MPHLPLEIVDEILIILGNFAPKRALIIATIIGRRSVQRRIAHKAYTLDEASKLNRVQWLDLIRLHDPHSFTSDALDRASGSGNIPLLDWWKSSGLKLKWTCYAIDEASSNGHVAVLEWWRWSGLRLEYSTKAMDSAMVNGQIACLDWWRWSGLEMKWTYTKGMGFTFHVAVLDWLKHSGLELNYDQRAMNRASWLRRLDVLDWWKSSGLPLKYTESCMEHASKHGHIDVLEWWRSSGLPLKYTALCLDKASREGRIDVLQWWRLSGLPLIFNKDNHLVGKYKYQVQIWWMDSGLLRDGIKAKQVDLGV
ncbi:hypothetical protein BJ742DRAFT_359877 [Cladochytrium replicatum]|nr:hypothetical protein BJ742DRAFT_359877 [Cladochytrium replicatum]